MMKLWRRRAALAARVCGILSIALIASTALGQGFARTATKFYPDFSDTADRQLRNAASHAKDGQWAEAIDIYQRVIQQYGDKVARLPKDGAGGARSDDSILYVDLRQFCQRRLAALPPEARAIYRGRVDAQAERWFRQGAADRDRALLRRVVDQAFCSSWGDDALDLLGDLAFEDGRFDEAAAMYRSLLPDRPEDRSGLIYPDPSVDLARVAAKKFLCRAALGDPAPDQGALRAYEQAYPNARGKLAGRSGPYLQIVREAIGSDRLAPPSQPDGRWPTFAGSALRTKVVPGRVDVGSLQWKVGDLPAYDPSQRATTLRAFGRAGFAPATPHVTPERLLSYHPIVLGDQVIICDENKILAYNLNDRADGSDGLSAGRVKPVWEAPPDTQENSGPTASQLQSSVPRYTLTAYGDRIYARLGPTMPHGGSMNRGALPAQTKIVAVDRGTEGKVLWSKDANDVTLPKRPADGLNRSIGFEGTPVADAHSVYVAMTDRREQTATYVACLDADNGATRWVRYLGAASSDNEGMLPFGGMPPFPMFSSDFGHRLLSLDGPTVYYQTNLGAVVALDADTGGIRWVATYPRLDRNDGGPSHERDLNPAIVYDGLVIVAPDDAASIYAFDAGTGQLVWKTEPIPGEVKLAHLLGVAKGRLIATGNQVLLFDVKNGKLIRSWPDAGNIYDGRGRGLLAGDRIYWPTTSEIHVLDQLTAQPADPSIKLQESFQTTGGNLAVGDGYLIVAQKDALVVFCQNSRLIQRYRDEIARAPDQAANYYRLAQAAEATGSDELALEALTTALAKVHPSETIDGLSLADAARDHQYRLLMKLGHKSAQAKDWDQAIQRYEAAAKGARSDRDRLLARLRLADVHLNRGAARDAVVTLQETLADERLRLLTVAAEDGHRSIRADLLIGDRLARIVRNRRELYARYDSEARRLLDRGRDEKDPRLLEEVSRSYPASESVPESLLALGQLCDGLQRPADAAHAYKRLLVSAPNDALRARALWGLARAYEAQRLWVPARDTYVDAYTRFGNVPLEEYGTHARVATLVSARLLHEPFDHMTADRSEPSLPVPLVRRWAKPLSGTFRPLAADGVPPSADACRIFLVRASELQAVDLASGAPLWSADLGGTPAWVGYLADRIIAATETRVVALSLDKGTVQWHHDIGGPHRGRPVVNPFAKPDAEPNAAASTLGRIHGFRIMGGRVFCLRGDRELLAFDGDSGLVDWSFAPTTGTLSPYLWIGPHRIVLQVQKPAAVLVLETETGRRKAEFASSDAEAWLRAPLPIDDDHVALVPDNRTVELFDLKRGVSSWVFHETRELPKNGPPRLIGNAERLLVIHDGSTLIRLDPATGTKRWERPLGTENLSERPEATCFDGDRFYWASDRLVSAASLEDGALVWSRYLTGPESGWAVALSDRCVLAFPVASNRADGECESFPLVFRRRDSGELVQRLLFPAAVSDIAVRLAPRGAVVATHAGVWALGERGAPVRSAFVAPK